MHRVSHVRRDTEGNSDAFAAPDIERLTIGIGSAVDRPNIGRHVTAKRCRQGAVDGPVRKRIQSPKPLFLSVVESCGTDAPFVTRTTPHSSFVPSPCARIG